VFYGFKRLLGLSLGFWDVGYRTDESTGALLYTFPGQQNGLRLPMLVSSFNFQLDSTALLLVLGSRGLYSALGTCWSHIGSIMHERWLLILWYCRLYSAPAFQVRRSSLNAFSDSQSGLCSGSLGRR
jgi:hypothetical protein